MDTFNGLQLRIARNFHSRTTTELGNAVGVSHSFIVQLESGAARTASASLLAALAEQLGVSTKYFFCPSLASMTEDNVFFRSRKTTLLSVRNKALAHMALFHTFVAYLDHAITLPAQNLPVVAVHEPADIERAAVACRDMWGLGQNGPIDNMVRALENNGVIVARFNAEADKIDAFSRYGSRHVVVLNAESHSITRSRYDCAHECGHLVMHGKHPLGVEYDEQLESQANQFASALLLPRVAFTREFPRGAHIDWPALFAMKKRWKVSLSALVRRAYELQLITASEYQRAYKYMSAHNWRKVEPYEPSEPERSEMLENALGKLKNLTGLTADDIAQKLYWSAELFTRVTGIRSGDTNTSHEEVAMAEVISLAEAKKALQGLYAILEDEDTRSRS